MRQKVFKSDVESLLKEGLAIVEETPVSRYYLRVAPRPGAPRKLNENQLKELDKMIQGNPADYGCKVIKTRCIFRHRQQSRHRGTKGGVRQIFRGCHHR